MEDPKKPSFAIKFGTVKDVPPESLPEQPSESEEDFLAIRFGTVKDVRTESFDNIPKEVYDLLSELLKLKGNVSQTGNLDVKEYDDKLRPFFYRGNLPLEKEDEVCFKEPKKGMLLIVLGKKGNPPCF